MLVKSLVHRYLYQEEKIRVLFLAFDFFVGSPFSMLNAKEGNYGYHFYNVFGMTPFLTWD